MIDFRLSSATRIQLELGQRLRHQRLDRDWTQAELAERAGVALSAVKGLEAGRNATLRTIIKVAQALSIVQDLTEVFAPKPATTIAEMERAEVAPRQRARRRAVAEPTTDLARKIRARFKSLGDVRLPIEPREPVRQPPVRLAKPEAAMPLKAIRAKRRR